MQTDPNPYANTQSECDRVSSMSGCRTLLHPGCLLAGCILAALPALYIAFNLGWIACETQRLERQAAGRMARIQSLLRDNPQSFRDVTVEEGSGGYVYLRGTVDSHEDLALLKQGMEKVFGEEIAEDIGWPVQVRGFEHSCEWNEVEGWAKDAQAADAGQSE